MTRRRLLAVALFAVVLAGGVWIWREYVAWRVAPLRHALTRVPVTRLGVCTCRPDSTITIPRGDGLTLAAYVYRPSSRAAAPGPRPLLLLHGLTPRGASLPVYRVLARRLADAGFLVFAVDFAGFGGSGDPYQLESEAALDLRRDVRAALDALGQLAATPRGFVLAGHSMGAIEAMAVGLDDPRVSLVVAIGPPRRTAEILATDEGREYHWNRIRRTYDSVYHRPLPAWLTRDRFLALKRERDIESFAVRWMMPGHVPLLLVDGAREDSLDRAYLQAYAARVAAPGAYLTVPDADHYLNTGALGRYVYYDRKAVGTVVDAVAGGVPRMPESG